MSPWITPLPLIMLDALIRTLLTKSYNTNRPWITDDDVVTERPSAACAGTFPSRGKMPSWKEKPNIVCL